MALDVLPTFRFQPPRLLSFWVIGNELIGVAKHEKDQLVVDAGMQFSGAIILCLCIHNDFGPLPIRGFRPG